MFVLGWLVGGLVGSLCDFEFFISSVLSLVLSVVCPYSFSSLSFVVIYLFIYISV